MGYRILGDVHTHTLYSRHAYSTIQENVQAAAHAGLEWSRVDGPPEPHALPEQHVRNFQYFINMGIWPRGWQGVTLLHGCEADVEGLDGSLFGQDIACTEDITGRALRRERTLFERVTSAADYVIASVHNAEFASGCDVARITDMYIAVLEQPRVLILGHTGRSGLPYDLDTVLTCAKERQSSSNQQAFPAERGSSSGHVPSALPNAVPSWGWASPFPAMRTSRRRSGALTRRSGCLPRFTSRRNSS